MKGLTIDELAKMCKKQQLLGNGKKCILMSTDDEGNSYHQAWEGLNDGGDFKGFVNSYQLDGCISNNIEDYVVLT